MLWGVDSTAEATELARPMPWGTRLLFGALGFFPLLAPYELIWTRSRGGPALFEALAWIVSLGAMALSALLFAAAVLGLSQTFRFDWGTRSLAIERRTALGALEARCYPFDRVRGLSVEEEHWSDGPSTFALVIETGDERRWPLAGFETREQAEQLRGELGAKLGVG